MLPFLGTFATLFRTTSKLLLPPQILIPRNSFHLLSKPNPTSTSLQLAPNQVAAVQSCGMKVVGKVKRRCRDCFLVWRQDRLYNMCHTHGRHKQALMQMKPKRVWILTHCTQGKYRPW